MYKYNTTDLDLQIASKHTVDVELGRRRNEHHQNDGREKALSTECPKKMSFCGKTAITTFKLIQNAKVGGVLENLGYLLQHGH